MAHELIRQSLFEAGDLYSEALRLRHEAIRVFNFNTKVRHDMQNITAKLLGFSIALTLAVTSGALAHSNPVNLPGAGNSAGAANNEVLPTVVPRYVVKIYRFYCGDESGRDSLGPVDWSDEPFWVFTAKTEQGQPITFRSKEFSDIDSGEWGRFDGTNNMNVVWPAKGAIDGAPGEIGLSIQLYEADGGNKDKITQATETAFRLGGSAPFVGEWVNRVPSILRNKLSNWLADDGMGSETLFYSKSELERRLPKNGMWFDVIQHFTTGGNNPPDYDLYMRVVRVH